MRCLSLAALTAISLIVASPVVAQPAPTTPSAAQKMAPAPAAKAAPAPAPTAAKPAELIDINSAPQSDLDKLTGIGPARAAAIIKGRPYKGKDDLVQKKIIPQSVYDGIKDKIIARQKS